MLKVFIITGIVAVSLISCDVRTKDKIADGSDTSKTAETESPRSPSIPTTVEIIDSVFDFGKIAEGEVVEYSFRFKNNGTQPLIINNASASCGCTIPEKPEAPVKPGETSFIKVKFNSEGRPGTTHKTVTVTSNATPAFPELVMKGEVIAKSKNN